MEFKAMRDVLIDHITDQMETDKKVFFVSADFGSPALDRLRQNFEDRFINVGIAEQNLINISAGLALEGYNVYSYAIAPFLTMRAYEQIRIHLSILSQRRPMNVNLIGVGCGLSYDVTGPTHHCFEDLSVINTLPNIEIFSPCDKELTKRVVEYSSKVVRPKYFRLDGKNLPDIYHSFPDVKIEDSFFELIQGKDVCIVSTGYMTHKAISIATELKKQNISAGVIDLFLLKPLKEGKLHDKLSNYKCVISLEEGFINKGGLDTIISCLLRKNRSRLPFKGFGFGDSYIFEVGGREYLHGLVGLDIPTIQKEIVNLLA